MLPIRIETHGSSMAKNREMSAPAAICSSPLRSKVRSRLAMPVAVLVMIIGSFGLAACVAYPPEVTLDDDQLVEGREVYARSCASCHGSAGDGGVGRKLSGGAVVEAYPNIKDQIDLIASGKGTMPSYTGRLTGQQMEAVARYTREVL